MFVVRLKLLLKRLSKKNADDADNADFSFGFSSRGKNIFAIFYFVDYQQNKKSVQIRVIRVIRVQKYFLDSLFNFLSNYGAKVRTFCQIQTVFFEKIGQPHQNFE